MLTIKKDIYESARRRMVEAQIVKRGVAQPEVIEAMLRVPRHLFVDEAFLPQAYSDYPLPIGYEQTISQPYIVAYMTEALGLRPTDKVLEIGTGSGYQSAVLSMVVEKVYSVERILDLANRARRILDSMHCTNVLVKVGDGTKGWAEHGPYDAIMVTAGAPEVPKGLAAQLKEGGRLVIPVGGETVQELIRITKKDNAVVTERLGGCRFVKLIGKNGWQAKGDSFV